MVTVKPQLNEYTENPIRKRRSVRLKNPYGGPGLALAGFWYAICPDCSEMIGGGHSRKQVKDALHRHRKKGCK